ncbi:hypothetical protein ACTFIW_006528 [Dictyostelium discoideum]
MEKIKNKEKRSSIFSKKVQSSKSVNKGPNITPNLGSLSSTPILYPINEIQQFSNISDNLSDYNDAGSNYESQSCVNLMSLNLANNINDSKNNNNNNNSIKTINSNNNNCDTSSNVSGTFDPECLKSCYHQVKDLIESVVIERSNQDLIQELLAFRFLIEKFNVIIKVNSLNNTNQEDTEISNKIKIISNDLKIKIDTLSYKLIKDNLNETNSNNNNNNNNIINNNNNNNINNNSNSNSNNNNNINKINNNINNNNNKNNTIINNNQNVNFNNIHINKNNNNSHNIQIGKRV